MYMKKSIFMIIGVVIVVSLIIGFIRKQSQITISAKQSVTAEVAKNVVFSDENIFGAVIKNSEEAIISAQVGGNISNMYVKEGNYVKKGQILAHISTPETSARYTTAGIGVQMVEEQEKNARRKWDDYKPEEREEFKLATERARALQSETGALLAKSQIRAPFEGIISKKFVETGSTVMPGEQIIYMVGNVNYKEVIIDVPVSVGQDVSVGNNVMIVNEDVTTDAKIIAVSPVSDIISRKMTIRIAIDENTPFTLGSFVDVIIQSDESKQGISISKESIVKQYDDTFIFVIIDGIAHIKNVQVVDENSADVIVEGVDEGDVVIISGAHDVRDGDEVEIFQSVK